jgi:hypothetical protein
MKKILFAKYGTAFVLLVMLLCIGNTMAFGYIPWENDPFDSLATGSLNGKNGWTGTPSAQIILDPDIGSSSYKILKIDPAAGQTITNSKNISHQDFLVRCDNTDPLQPTIAKLAVFTGGANGVMKFQVYFGANIRISYILPDKPENKYFLKPSTVSGKWYWIHLVINLTENKCYAFVDGDYVDPEEQGNLDDNAIPSGSVTGLVITGWDRPGTVYLDDIYGIRRSAEIILP